MMPTLLLGAALVSAWILGALIVIALWPRERPWRADAALVFPLGALVGIGATSVSFFFASLLSPQPALVAGIFDLVLAVALARLVQARRPTVSTHSRLPWSWLEWALATAFVQAAAVAAVLGARAYSTEPYGGWDGWAIWNLHARFLLRAGPGWPQLLAAPPLNWTHPDYPCLLPTGVARLWAWAGRETPAAAGLLSALFASAVVALLVATIARLRGRTAALLGGLVLLGTPFFVTFATNEHADIPLAAYMLAAVALALLGEQWTLAGLCAGFAAWTKNEGLLFSLVFGLGGALRVARSGGARDLGRLAAGAALALAPVVYFKLCLAPPNDLAAAPLAPRLTQLFDAARHHAILTAGRRDLAHFGEWQWTPWLALALPFFAWRSRRRLAAGEWLAPAIAAAMLGGYYVVYLLSPHDLAWHLDTSLVRLLLQLWPLALLAWCLTVPLAAPPATASASTGSRPPRTWAVFVAANAVCAFVLVGALSRQLAANELAAKGNVRVALADGWFGVERYGRDTWTWSGGDASLRVATSAAPQEVTLRFALRALGPRTITVRAGDRVLWQGRVAENFLTVTTPPLPLTSEAVRLITFTSDAPPQPESSAAGARALAFALYNLRLE